MRMTSVFLGGFPGPLRDLFAIWSEELDALYDQDSNQIVIKDNTELKAGQEYEAKTFCDLIHLEGAKTLAEYKSDFYAGRPALTVNDYGKGKAYYIASRNEDKFLEDFYYSLVSKLNLSKTIASQLPEGVTAQKRSDKNYDYIFLMNFSECEKKIDLTEELMEFVNEDVIKNSIILEKYEVKIFKKTNSLT